MTTLKLNKKDSLNDHALKRAVYQPKMHIQFSAHNCKLSHQSSEGHTIPPFIL